MALTVNREVDHFVDQELRSYQVESAKQIFKGGFVGLSDSSCEQPNWVTIIEKRINNVIADLFILCASFTAN